jgi:hypothetical protein
MYSVLLKVSDYAVSIGRTIGQPGEISFYCFIVAPFAASFTTAKMGD